MSSRRRAGDWMCPNCDFLIFADKRSCRKCGASKPCNYKSIGGRKKYDKSGIDEWICSNCSSSNFPDRLECRKCKTHRPDIKHKSKPKKQKKQKKEGVDWICNICKTSNFSHRQQCRKCDKYQVISDDEEKKQKIDNISSTNLMETVIESKESLESKELKESNKLDVEFKYFTILISKSPHRELGKLSEWESLHLLQFKPSSKYFIDKHKCPHCHCSNTDNKILQFKCSYIDNVPFHGQYIDNSYCFGNIANEYQCKECEFYIAFSFKNKMFPNGQLSALGHRNKCIYIQKYRNNNKIIKCPECKYDMELLQRSESSQKISAGGHTSDGYYSPTIRYEWNNVDFCKNCDLVLSKREIYDD